MVSVEHEHGTEHGGDAAHQSHAGELAKAIPALVVLAVIVVFAFANTQTTSVDFVFTTKRAPLVVVLAATAVAGALASELFRFRRRHHR